MSQPDQDAPPDLITVKGSASKVVVPEVFKVAMAGGLAVLADRTLHSETAIIAVMACAGYVAVFAWGVLHRLKSWRALKFLAAIVPDDIAVVKP